MKKTVISVIVLALLITACAPKSYTGTFYLLSPTPVAGAKKIGCEEYLVPIKKEFSYNTTYKNANRINALDPILVELLNADPKDYGSDYLSATAFKDKYIQLESADASNAHDAEERNDSSDTITVRLKTNSQGGIAGICDVPRIKEQITETIKTYAGATQFKINLDGSESKWRCLEDQSGLCQ